jgi:hypothetical protein
MEAVEAEDSVPRTSEEACQWCGNKAECQALRTLALVQGSYVSLPEPVKITPGCVVTPDDRAKMQTLAVILEDWAKQIKSANTAAVIQDGVEIPGFVLRQRAGNTTICDTAKAVELLVEELPVNTVLAAASLSLPKITDIYTAERGGNKKDNREKLEAKLKDVLTQGEPVVYLQRGKSAANKGAIANG